HMAFNGSEHFPHNELVQYLESVGTQFGPHLNAHTSFDETVYKLMVPTDDDEIFEKAFLVLEDWAHGLTFDPEEIDKERGVVLEEWRLRRGVQGRQTDLMLPLQFHGSLYADRLPIGTEESLKTFDPAALRRFYADWYRPDLMAVIVAGDVDPDRVQALIEEHFGGIPAVEQPRERTRFTIPDHEETLYGIFADPEMPRASVSVMALVDDPESTTVGGYRGDLMDQVGTLILQERLDALARQPDPPFIGAGGGKRRFLAGRGSWNLGAAVQEDGILRGWEALLVEAERLRRHGVRPGELDRAKAAVLKQYASMVADADKEDSTAAADEIVRHFLVHEPMPGIPVEGAMAERFVPEFTVEELNAWAKGFLPRTTRIVSVAMPQKEGLAVPTETDLAKVEAKVANMEIEALPPEAEIPPLLSTEPTPGTVVSRDDQYAAASGFTGLVLSNGVKVWMKKTDFKNDEVLFQGFSKGGESLLADEDVVSARLMLDTLWQSGIGQQDRDTLDRWLAGRKVQVNASLAESFELVNGSASPSDLEAALQMLYGAVVEPRFDAEALQVVLAQQAARLVNRGNDPNAVFDDALTALAWDDPRRTPWTPETLEQADLERMKALHADRFGDLSDLTFVLVGNLPDDAEALVATWLGGLPAKGREESWKDRGFREKPGKLEGKVEQGIEAKARVHVDWHGDFAGGWDERFQLYQLGDVLSVMLREKLREELGGVYGVRVSASDEFAPYRGYVVRVDFSCDPERVDELLAATYGVIDTVRKDGPPERIVDQEKEKRLRRREQDVRENRWWLNIFTQSLERGVDPTEILDLPHFLDELSVQSAKDAAKRLLDDRNRVQMVLLPAGE
ncbi:MAG: insulinase family protein, partial [Myxococcales bacterium]|nr:insulinase family protein [Myxococcales bacterium]